MNKIRRLLPVFIALLFCSCSVIKEGVYKTKGNLKTTSTLSLEGTYSNATSDFEITEYRGESHMNSENTYLWRLFKTFPKKSTDEIKQNSSVKIKSLSQKTAQISLIYGDSIMDVRKVRGKIKAGYFYPRRQWVVFPFFPLAFGYHNTRMRLTTNASGELIIEKAWNKWAFAVFAGIDTRGQSKMKFERN